MTMPPVEVMVTGVREGHRRLHATVGAMSDADARRPSRLPGWSVGHVVTHLARNADSMVRRIEAAHEERLVDQYPGGPQARADGIEAGAGRSAAELLADLVAADDAVDRLFAVTPGPVWDRPIRTPSGGSAPAARLAYSRWREVEVHHVDLGLGYSPADWPEDFVAAVLPALVDGLADRTDPAALAAWALDRGPAPLLRSWD